MTSSPCIGKCHIDDQTGFCSGCARSRAEIAAWRDASPDDRERICAELPARRESLGLKVEQQAPLDCTGSPGSLPPDVC
ncbi:DUF1289 domain-containing protein [Rhodoblastus acidophilus]|uniref:DUF1289 domain-containing protein n=1 Tax=Rhodoblastus acidophilus TaxID=1074 RepID=UPI000B511D9B|nr:DUF1289 domain-containing protein [Rhodoblastus acidophilus]PPQ37283.1 DUF1289 domain-containing protein [Rhodoblastus acidophilus]RAI16451.1 DUF1289 domain-containing protein [Rhodoblastus acidophilus]